MSEAKDETDVREGDRSRGSVPGTERRAELDGWTRKRRNKSQGSIPGTKQQAKPNGRKRKDEGTRSGICSTVCNWSGPEGAKVSRSKQRSRRAWAGGPSGARICAAPITGRGQYPAPGPCPPACRFRAQMHLWVVF